MLNTMDVEARKSQIRKIISDQEKRKAAIAQANILVEDLQVGVDIKLHRLDELRDVGETPVTLKEGGTLLGQAFAGNHAITEVSKLLRFLNEENADIEQLVERIDTFIKNSASLPSEAVVILIPVLAKS